ncbi:GTP cyclohydrolase I FolE [Bacillus cereus]|uniref:GTP cyclohydrolase I FolE n=1 Tax=Bacillus cereus TaxID=1396 RepID=UPI003D02495C
MIKDILNDVEKQDETTIVDQYYSIIKNVGENPNREGLLKTPERAAKAIKFLTSGYEQDIDKMFNGAIFEENINNNNMVVVKDIEFYSLCEHHMLPFWGVCHVGYIPNGKIVGLSKIARLVNLYARRLQVQERLTEQIAHTLQEYLEPHGVAVIIEAKHLCMMMRGVEKQQSKTVTDSMVGVFQETDVSNKFFKLTKER